MTDLPERLYRAAAVRELERRAEQHAGVNAVELMERAGGAAFQALRRHWSGARRPLIVCGGGNNGGDGYIVARLAREQGMEPHVLALGQVDTLPPAASTAARKFRDAGGRIRSFPDPLPGDADVIVDALLGTGLTRVVEGDFALAIGKINEAGLPVLSLDVPSGLNADTGAILGCATCADATITFLGLKPGLFTGEGPDCAGALEFATLGIDSELAEGIDVAAVRVGYNPASFPLPRRARAAHKGKFGHVLVVGGDTGFAGAPLLAGEAAARVGAGLVTLATRPGHAGLQVAARPELMAAGIEQPMHLDPLLRRASVIAIGPGLGLSQWSSLLLSRVFESKLPLVVDADALTLLARDAVQRPDWVLTPHPGEAARLLGCTVGEIQQDRIAAAQALQSRYGGTVVLKGCGTLVARGNAPTAVCTDGNPGMASGGMGDVLTGVIAGLMAQGLDPGGAALAGVCLHSAAADRAAADGERGLLAGDLMPWLRRLANPER
ncbi:MAG: NAD(P)H-hydrate dehydratase [Gammaproteobacteria bacterium]|nr:NAD(P)H-hydrate dehydratase [Gammaproteobacteria bacterium]